MPIAARVTLERYAVSGRARRTLYGVRVSPLAATTGRLTARTAPGSGPDRRAAR